MKDSAESPDGLRQIVILGSGVFLLGSILYGPGRGLSSIPAGHPGLGVLKVVTYAAILGGALGLPRHRFLGVLLLALGIGGRLYLEWRASLARQWLDGSDAIPAWGWLLAALAYGANFVLPSLLLIDSIRSLRRARAGAPAVPGDHR